MNIFQQGGAYVTAKLADPPAAASLTLLARSFFETFDWLTAFKAGTSRLARRPQNHHHRLHHLGLPWVGSFAVLTTSPNSKTSPKTSTKRRH